MSEQQIERRLAEHNQSVLQAVGEVKTMVARVETKVDGHHEKLNDHETRLRVNEHKLARWGGVVVVVSMIIALGAPIVRAWFMQ